MPLLDLFWAMLWFFVWIAWILLLLRVFGDIFRSDSSGAAKAGWSLFVIFLPFLGVFIYLIANGGQMAQRDVDAAMAMEKAQKEYIRSAAGAGSVADEIEKLSALKSQGALTADEFAAQKAKLLA